MYRVIKQFADRFDGGRIYKVGDTYPRAGHSPPSGRAGALLRAKKSELNKLGKAYIAEEPDEDDGVERSVKSMTKAELISFAEEKGVEGINADMTKAQIIEVIEAAV